MSLFSRRKKKPSPRSEQAEARQLTMDHFSEFARTRVGVEALIEPATSVTQTTMLLIATDGEWTRRRVPDEPAAREIAGKLNIPVYDVNLVGYPQRMRDWNARQRPRRR